MLVDEQVFSFKVVDDWVYYIGLAFSPAGVFESRSLYRMQASGINKSILVEDFIGCGFSISSGWVYYFDKDDSGGRSPVVLCKIRIDGTSKTELNKSKGVSNLIAVTGNWIYYADFFDNSVKICRIPSGGSKNVETIPIEGHFVSPFDVIDGWIYFVKIYGELDERSVGEKSVLYRMRGDGTGSAESIVEDDSKYLYGFHSYIVHNDWVYYAVAGRDAFGHSIDVEISKVRINGNDRTRLIGSSDNRNIGSYLSIDDDWIYYTIVERAGDGFSGGDRSITNAELYKMNVGDNSNIQRIA
jgi:hypothetical protein